jgi:hypothetical protein
MFHIWGTKTLNVKNHRQLIKTTVCETSVTLDLSKLIVLDPQSQTPKYKIDNEGSVSYQIMSSNCTLNIEGSAKFDDTVFENNTLLIPNRTTRKRLSIILSF